MLPVRFFRDPCVMTPSSGLLGRWGRDFDRVWDGFFPTSGSGVFPVDIRTEGEQTVIEAELPGYNRDEIEVDVENGMLTITAENKKENNEEQEGYHLRERRWGRVSRSFRLNETIDTDNVQADLKDGVLTLRFSIKPEAKPRRIEVK